MNRTLRAPLFLTAALVCGASMAEELGLTSEGIDALRNALDDHALVPDVATRSLDRARFVAEVAAIARDLTRPQSQHLQR